MTQPPRPVAPQPRATAPTGVRAADRTTAAANAGIPDVSVGTARPRASRLREVKEHIQLCGDSNSGKTFAWMSEMVRRFAERIQDPDAPPFRVYCIDTDNTMPVMLTEGGEFHGMYIDDGGPISVYPCDNWADVVGSTRTFIDKVKEDDFIIVDVANQAYDMCVAEVARVQGIDPQSETFRRIQNNQGFGAFDSNIWNAVTVLFDGWTRRLMMSPAHVIFVQHLTDYVTERSNREVILAFDQIGVKPQGAKKIFRIVNTSIFLYTIRQIPKDERGRRLKDASTKIVRKMDIVKDRGRLTYASREYDTLFWNVLKEVRETGAANTVTITEPNSAAAIVADALAEIRKTQSGASEDTPGGTEGESVDA